MASVSVSFVRSRGFNLFVTGYFGFNAYESVSKGKQAVVQARVDEALGSTAATSTADTSTGTGSRLRGEKQVIDVRNYRPEIMDNAHEYWIACQQRAGTHLSIAGLYATCTVHGFAPPFSPTVQYLAPLAVVVSALALSMYLTGDLRFLVPELATADTKVGADAGAGARAGKEPSGDNDWKTPA